MSTNLLFKYCELPSESLLLFNSVFVSKEDFNEVKQKSEAKKNIYILINKRMFELKQSEGIEKGSMAMSKRNIEFIQKQMQEINSDLLVSKIYNKKPLLMELSRVTFQVSFLCSVNRELSYEESDIIQEIRNKFSGTPLNKNQELHIIVKKAKLLIKAEKLENDPRGPKDENKEYKYYVNLGFLTNETNIDINHDNICNPQRNHPKIKRIQAPEIEEEKENRKEEPSLPFERKRKNLSFNFEEMGIGGLDKEIGRIFKRAFTTRFYSTSQLSKYGINHVKGMLLYGPPGTGKTLIARTLAKNLENVLNVKEFKVVNGPELFDKYVGETEKKIRELFENAEKDQKENGDKAGLHVIVFDEIDSICRARGTIDNGTGVHDGAVNQLLTKIDGVDSLNNILVIGMTNRKDLIDEAILRPGRLELHVEIGLPDEKGRLDILKIHTRRMKENNVLGNDVDLSHLAQITKNYTGADLESLVKIACANALSFEGMQQEKIENKDSKVGMAHFLEATKEIYPMFGIDSEELNSCLEFGMINYGKKFEILSSKINSLINQIKNTNSISLLSVLLEGDSGCGKTALAANLALKSTFPYIKIISPEFLVKYLETGKYSAISNIFEDAYKSPSSIIILDNIEKLIEYIQVGQHFSNLLLQTLLVYIKKKPTKAGKKLLIIGTTSMLSDLSGLGVVKSFDRIIHIPNLNEEEIKQVLESYDCDAQEKRKIADLVKNAPIKKLFFLIDRALQKNKKLLYENFESEYKDYVFNNYLAS